MNSKHVSRAEETPPPKPRAQRRGRGEATELACSRLLRLVQTMPANARLPGLRTLQAQIGVSQGTLNAALDKLEQKRVLFRRERSGVFVAPNVHQRTICLVASLDFFLRSNGSPFWQLLIERAENIARARDSRLVIAFAEAGADGDTLPPYLRDEIRQNNFDGVVAIGLPAPVTGWIEAQNVPVVAFAGSARYTVLTSRLSLIEQGVAALAEAGGKNVALLISPHDHAHGYLPRLSQAFVAMLESCRIPHGTIAENEDVKVPGDHAYHPPRIENGWEWAHRVFGANTAPAARPDAVLFGDDMIGLGALMAWDNLGIVPGRDVHVVCYANRDSPVLLGWQNRIYRLEHDVSELMERIFATLDSLIDAGDDALTGAFVPPMKYDGGEYAPETPGERFQLVRPRLLPPERPNL